MHRILPLLLSAIVLLSCQKGVNEQLADAESLLFTNPDSTLTLLDRMGMPEDEEEAAQWSMLKAWAQYRNYEKKIDTEALHRAFNYFADSKDMRQKARVYYLRSVIHEDQKLGNADEWTEDLYQACRAVEQTDDHPLASRIYQGYGVKMQRAKRLDEAVKWDKKNLQEAILAGEPHEEISAMLNLGISLLFQEDELAQKKAQTKDGVEVAKYTQFRNAIEMGYKTVAKAREYNLLSDEGKAWGNLAMFYSRAQRLDSALICAIKAKDINEEELRKGLIKRVRYIPVAEAYRKIEQPDSALKYALIETSNPELLVRSNASQQLYIIYRDLVHDYEKTVYWMEMWQAQQDSLRNQQSWNIEVGEIKVEKAELQEDLQHTRNYLWWLVGALVVLAVLCLFVWRFLRYRYRMQLSNLEHEMNLLLQGRANQQAAVQSSADKAERTVTETIAEIQQEKTADNLTVSENLTVLNPSATSKDSDTSATSKDSDTSAISKDSDISATSKDSDTSANPATSVDSETPQVSPAAEPANKVPAPLVTPSTQVADEVDLSGGVREKLLVRPVDILFITSEHNYMKVVYLHDGKVEHKLTRRTMTEMEQTFLPYPEIIRCHRAFLVNIAHAQRLSSSQGSLYITLRSSSTPIPVSRSYIKQVRAAIEG